MPTVATHTLTQGKIQDADQIYNGLDCTITFEIWERLAKQNIPKIYDFERALQGPALEIMLRGFLIDKVERDKAVAELTEKLNILSERLDALAKAVWDKPLNPRSVEQLKSFFYDYMRLPECVTSIKGVSALRMNRESLEALAVHVHARPLINTILAIREYASKIKVLTTDLDSDGRFRTSINVGATETGRFSSSKSTTGTGGNLFNITRELRRPFVSDPGYKICAIDLEQAESREVGFICGKLFNDWAYLDACEAGDLHTRVASMVWPQLSWTGDAKADREIAERGYYRHFTYRDMAKRNGHANNYLITPYTASRSIKCPISICQAFKDLYFTAFPGIAKWHQWVATQLGTMQQLTTMFGRKRIFFGRPNDDSVLREAVAYEPQSCTADRLNIGMLRIWKHFGTRVQLLLQLYDAVYFQYREDDDEVEIVQKALELLDVPVWHNGRKFTVPGEAKVGWNWADYVSEEDINKAVAAGRPAPKLNLDGLRKFKGKDSRKRTEVLHSVL